MQPVGICQFVFVVLEELNTRVDRATSTIHETEAFKRCTAEEKNVVWLVLPLRMYVCVRYVRLGWRVCVFVIIVYYFWMITSSFGGGGDPWLNPYIVDQ